MKFLFTASKITVLFTAAAKHQSMSLPAAWSLVLHSAYRGHHLVSPRLIIHLTVRGLMESLFSRIKKSAGAGGSEMMALGGEPPIGTHTLPHPIW